MDAEPPADNKIDIRAFHFMEQVKQRRLKVGHRNHFYTG